MQINAGTIESQRFIIDKVAEVLREERATATKIESAVNKAGIDRDEINVMFGSMHDLILEMVSDLSGEITQPLQDRAMGRSIRDVLIDFGHRLAHTYYASHLVALHRIVQIEATLHSSIKRKFFERGPGRVRRCLAEYLEFSARRFKHIRINNAARFAGSFIGLLADNLEFSDAMATTRISPAKDHSDAVIETVELFCHGIVRRHRDALGRFSAAVPNGRSTRRARSM